MVEKKRAFAISLRDYILAALELRGSKKTKAAIDISP